MSKTVHISSTDQFSALLSSSTIVVADFYADWCGPCKQIAPIFEQLSAQLSRPNKITFAKIDTDKQQDLSRSYGVKAMPTFMVFKNARRVEFIEGANPRQLSSVVKDLANEVNKMDSGDASESSGGPWLGAELPRGYTDVTSQVDFLGLELLNWDSEHGNARTLINNDKPKGEQPGTNALRFLLTLSQVRQKPNKIGLKATRMNN
jgi:thioredoxin